MVYNYKDDNLIKNYPNDKINFPEKTLTFFELKNDVKRTTDKKTIDLDILISHISTFVSKLPIYMKLYKSKGFVDENCNNVKYVYFYDHNNGKFEDSIKTKNLIKSEIDKNFKNSDININIQIIFGSKQIQAINYYELFLENKKTKAELGNTKVELGNTKVELGNTKAELGNTKAELEETKDRVNKLENELKDIKKYLSNIKNEDVEFKEEKKERKKKNIIDYEKIDKSNKPEKEKKEIIELDEQKMMINEKIDKLKENLKGIKLKIFEKAIGILKLKKNINEYDINIIQKLSNKLTKKEYKNIDDEKNIENYALNLVNKFIK